MIRSKFRVAIASVVALVMGFPLTERALAQGLEFVLGSHYRALDCLWGCGASSSDC